MPTDLEVFNKQLASLRKNKAAVLAELKEIEATNLIVFPAVSNKDEDGLGLLVNYSMPSGLYPLIAINERLSELVGCYVQIFPRGILLDGVLARARVEGVEL